MSDKPKIAEWPTEPTPIDGLVFRLDPPDVFTVPGSMVGPPLALPEVERAPDAYASDEKPDGETWLSWLDRRKVFSIQKVEGGFEVWEECDRYYSATLTREHLLQLAEELKQLAEGA